MVSLMVLSHSAKIAQGAKELALQMSEEANIIALGGTKDGGLGTDYDGICAAMEEAAAWGEVVVLADLGSARLCAEMARDALDDRARERVFLCDAALVEGTVVAAVAIAGGGNAEKIIEQLADCLLSK